MSTPKITKQKRIDGVLAEGIQPPSKSIGFFTTASLTLTKDWMWFIKYWIPYNSFLDANKGLNLSYLTVQRFPALFITVRKRCAEFIKSSGQILGS